MHELYFTSIVFLLSRRVEWTITWPWKVMLKIWPQVKVMTWPEKIMLHISRSVSSAWTHLLCFHRSSLSLSKVILEKLLVTFHGLKWPWWHAEGSSIAIVRLRVSILPLTRCLSVFWMVFVQKRRLLIFIPLTYNGEVTKLSKKNQGVLTPPPARRGLIGFGCHRLSFSVPWCGLMRRRTTGLAVNDIILAVRHSRWHISVSLQVNYQGISSGN